MHGRGILMDDSLGIIHSKLDFKYFMIFLSDCPCSVLYGELLNDLDATFRALSRHNVSHIKGGNVTIDYLQYANFDTAVVRSIERDGLYQGQKYRFILH